MSQHHDEFDTELRFENPVVEAIGEVQIAVHRVEKAIEKKFSIVQFFISVIVILFFWSLAKDAWYSKWRLGWAYGVPAENVQLEKAPNDCKFLAAPIGEKYCHYNREITTIRWSRSKMGEAIESYDGGVSWTRFNPPAGAEVPWTPAIHGVRLVRNKVDE